jgi:hypothetical protein
MTNLECFAAYAADFEKTFKDDDWSRLERYFAAEETAFVKALKRRGRFVIPRATVLTSNRKLRTMTLRRAVAVLLPPALSATVSPTT